MPVAALRSNPIGVRCRAVGRCWRHGSAKELLLARRSAYTAGATELRDDRYLEPVVTDEGVKVFQADPNTASSGPGLTWGSVLWPSGTCLAKFLAWRSRQGGAGNISPRIDMDTAILELGCGTGVVGLTCARIGAGRVTLSDSESALWPMLRRSIAANGIRADRIEIRNLDWRDPTTFIDHAQSENRHDLVVAADVLYAGMDGLFSRALASHLPSRSEIGGEEPPEAVIACPFRADSPLLDFFRIAGGLGLAIDRLEEKNGDASGTAAGVDASESFDECGFIPLGDGERSELGVGRLERIAKEPKFSRWNRDLIQIFRVRRIRGTSAEARAIRRVGRL